MDSAILFLTLFVTCCLFLGQYVYADETLRDCPALQVPHATVHPRTNHGSTVVVDCPSPFILVGNPRPTCTNGTYTDVPSCVIQDEFDISEMNVADQTRINITASNSIWNVGWITGAKFLPDGRLILCDTDDYKIKLLSRDFEVEDKLSYRDGLISLWAVGIINDTTVVITKPFENEIEFVHYAPNLQRGRSVNIGTKCYGVDVLTDTIYLACYDGSIRLYDTGGNFQDMLQIRFQGPYWITANAVTEKLCVADWNARSITCMTPTGGVLFTYRDSSLRRPQAVLVDDHDNIVIADWDNDNIQVVRNGDMSKRNLLTSVNGIQSPYSLAYRRSDKILVVGLQWTKWFHIVRLT